MRQSRSRQPHTPKVQKEPSPSEEHITPLSIHLYRDAAIGCKHTWIKISKTDHNLLVEMLENRERTGVYFLSSTQIDRFLTPGGERKNKRRKAISSLRAIYKKACGHKVFEIKLNKSNRYIMTPLEDCYVMFTPSKGMFLEDTIPAPKPKKCKS